MHLGLAKTADGALMELILLRASVFLDLPEINAKRVRVFFYLCQTYSIVELACSSCL